ncbi:alcohol dehydrogenase catalytic domain-containing protein [Streptococcus devriesei]|uniref:alcohol dehydrogenase catalytic domain-containing protein n=1 Tax=Streptococcus devriesei TaxID=231233 RepID=UPI00041DC80C|nr:alcohol dehydrogenase catalytic domain-containing protein [Streptococcus devriesei]
MKALAVINTNILSSDMVENMQTVDIRGTNVTCGVVDIPRPDFNPDASENDDFVLVRVLAFSCNYRDKAIIVKSQLEIGKDKAEGQALSFFGSDFVARVEEVGKNVTNLSKGMRVIPNCYYPYQEYEGVGTGVVTNEASRGWLKLHKSKLLSIPDVMNDGVAASFSIGAQTSESMIRRSKVSQEDRVLVCSSRSNTSLFIIKRLLSMGVSVTALTTSEWTEAELEFVKPAAIITIKRGLRDWDELDIGKFDLVFDPFYDLNLLNSLTKLNFDGRYITCGFKNQHETFKESTDNLDSDRFNQLMLTVMIFNLHIIGNCIGTTEDLQGAINSFIPENPPIVIEKNLEITRGSEFLDATYNHSNRFGKIVMHYAD